MSTKAWTTKAVKLLKAPLETPRHELNDLDWKAALSPDTKRLTEHLSALANHPGGGCLVFGVDSAGHAARVDDVQRRTGANHDWLGRGGTVRSRRVAHPQVWSLLPGLHLAALRALSSFKQRL